MLELNNTRSLLRLASAAVSDLRAENRALKRQLVIKDRKIKKLNKTGQLHKLRSKEMSTLSEQVSCPVPDDKETVFRQSFGINSKH